MGYARLDENVRESTGWAEPASFSFQFTTSFGNYLDISVAVNVSYLLKMAVVTKMKHKPQGMIYNTSCMRPRPGIVMWLAGKWHVISLISLVMNKQYSCSTGQPVLLASMWSFTEGKKTDWRNDSIAVNFFIPDIHDYESSHLNTAAWTHKECRGFSLFPAYSLTAAMVSRGMLPLSSLCIFLIDLYICYRNSLLRLWSKTSFSLTWTVAKRSVSVVLCILK